MQATQRTARIQHRRIKPLNRRQKGSRKPKRASTYLQGVRNSMLAPPDFLASDVDEIWPTLSVPASVAIQYRAKVLHERKRLICIASVASACFVTVLGFAKALMYLLS